MKPGFLPWLAMLCIPVAEAIEQEVHGMIDIQLAWTDGIDSYLGGNYGKFRYDDGSQLALGQGSINYKLGFDDRWNFLAVANAYADDIDDSTGITEAYLLYKSLPSEDGYRFRMRAGLMYPKVSMTNLLNGWSSPYTLTYSAINSWLGEELRHRGLDFSITRLGKFSDSTSDTEVALAIFQANDPAGAVLSWHGWTTSSRQTLRHENLPLPNSHIGFVPPESNAFLELDNRIGYHINLQKTWHGQGKLLAGYYDNRGDPRVVEDLQWAWTTRFYHLGFKWRLAQDFELITQLLAGDTLMQNRSGTTDLVNNDYDSAFLMLSKKFGQHRVSGRIETFSVTDNDTIASDNNQEHGKAATLNHTYRFQKHWFAHAEFNWVDSDRPSRTGLGHPQRLIERQLLFAVRYFI